MKQAPLFGEADHTHRHMTNLPFRDWPVRERPQERYVVAGAEGLSDSEVLALIIGSARPNPLVIAQDILATAGGWHGLQRLSLHELMRLPGLGRARACQIKAALEVGRRLSMPPDDRPQIKSPADAAQLLLPELSYRDQEQLCTILLDTKNRVQAVATVYIGSVNTAMIRVGEIFKEAIRHNSPAMIVAHQHPSGDPTPSPEDVQVTCQIVAAGALLDIQVLDHLVLGRGRWISMRERGLGFASNDT